MDVESQLSASRFGVYPSLDRVTDFVNAQTH